MKLLTATLLLVGTLREVRLGDSLRPWILSFGAAAAVLDFSENHHILAMLRAAQAGLEPPLVQLFLREDFSALKWLLGQLAFVLVGLALPPRTWALRLFRFALLGVQMPVGVLALCVSVQPWAEALHWARLLNVLAGFLLVAALLPSLRADDSGGPA